MLLTGDYKDKNENAFRWMYNEEPSISHRACTAADRFWRFWGDTLPLGFMRQFLDWKMVDPTEIMY